MKHARLMSLSNLVILAAAGLLAACDNGSSSNSTSHANASSVALSAASVSSTVSSVASSLASSSAPALSFNTTEIEQFDSPWAMTFLPDGRLLITEMSGKLNLFDPATKNKISVSGVPEVKHVAQGGLGDVILHPNYSSNSLIYISYVEEGEGGFGGAVARAKLKIESAAASLEDIEIIWRQSPKKSGDGHFGYRLAFDKDGKLWISSSERKEFDPAQDLKTNLGKIIRLNDDGSVPDGNPFADQGDVTAQVWSYGHRNILGLAFTKDGNLWAHEMGPKGGDELNLIEKGVNYGYPLVSDGNHYDDKPIPNHDTRPDLRAPVISWTPVISPAGFIIYDGDLFSNWKGDGFIGGLSSMSLVRIEFDGKTAREAERFDMKRRIREVEQGPDGAIWLLEDGTRQGNGWLLKLTP